VGPAEIAIKKNTDGPLPVRRAGRRCRNREEAEEGFMDVLPLGILFINPRIIKGRFADFPDMSTEFS
jgi:hypothetical protein